MERFLILVGFIILLYQILKRIFGKRGVLCYEKPNLYLTLISIVLVLTVNYAIIFFGTKVPGSLLERSEYETVLYVRLYSNKNEVKSYKVPAIIRRVSGETCYSEDDCVSWSDYLIESALMPNGGMIVFESDVELELNKIIWMYDKESRYWGVELTHESVK